MEPGTLRHGSPRNDIPVELNGLVDICRKLTYDQMNIRDAAGTRFAGPVECNFQDGLRHG